MSFIRDLLDGGASRRNKHARKVHKIREENRDANYEFEWGDKDSDELGGQQKRKYDYAVDGLEILKRNTESNLDYQEKTLMQKWDHGMSVRAYEHQQNERVYAESVSRALNQQSFNEIANTVANLNQDRFLHEQLLTLAMDETEGLMQYRNAAAGLGLQQRQAKAGAAIQAQAERVAALKATGASVARGAAGRTAAKDVLGKMAESNARQGAIIEELMFSTEKTSQAFMGLNQQFMLDQVGYDFTRDSLMASDMSVRNDIRAAFLQATIDAENSVAMKPDIAPPLPKPFALPRPEFQDIFEPEKPPLQKLPPAAQESVALGFVNQMMSYASFASGMGAFDGAPSGNKSGGGNTTLTGGGVTVGKDMVSLGNTPITLPGSIRELG
tara:strand:+ start:4723 stop:5874 length:1152 start_codon:yes stop_codon:yes gene_type:complete